MIVNRVFKGRDVPGQSGTGRPIVPGQKSFLVPLYLCPGTKNVSLSRCPFVLEQEQQQKSQDKLLYPGTSRDEITKGQLISKVIYGLLTSPKKRTDEFVLFAFLLFTANKSNSSVRFLGVSTACQSAFRFFLTFSI